MTAVRHRAGSVEARRIVRAYVAQSERGRRYREIDREIARELERSNRARSRAWGAP